jgi:hypothetical protein
VLEAHYIGTESRLEEFSVADDHDENASKCDEPERARGPGASSRFCYEPPGRGRAPGPDPAPSRRYARR